MKIVILGGGIGGIVAANELRNRLEPEHKVTLVERSDTHSFAPSFLWVMTGDREPHRVTRPLRTLLRKGVELIHAEVKHIDTQAKSIHAGPFTIGYDFLIIALGAQYAPESIEGLQDAAQDFYSLEGAIRLRDALRSFSGGRVALVVAALPYKCPGAPHEGAMLIADFLRRRGLDRSSEVHLFTPELQPLPVAGPALGEQIRDLLTQKGIQFHPLHKLSKVDSEGRELVFADKDPFQYDLLAVVPPHRAPQAVLSSGLTNEAGWIPADRTTLATRVENVFAIGDVAAVSVPGRWKAEIPLMLPKAGVFAHAQAEIVAGVIAAKIQGNAYEEKFCGGGYCMLEVGDALAGFASGDFYAEPAPDIRFHSVGKMWHLGKILFENWWLAPIGIRKSILHKALQFGARLYKLPKIV